MLGWYIIMIYHFTLEFTFKKGKNSCEIKITLKATN